MSHPEDRPSSPLWTCSRLVEQTTMHRSKYDKYYVWSFPILYDLSPSFKSLDGEYENSQVHQIPNIFISTTLCPSLPPSLPTSLPPSLPQYKQLNLSVCFRFLHCTEEDLQPFIQRLNDKASFNYLTMPSAQPCHSIHFSVYILTWNLTDQARMSITRVPQCTVFLQVT